MLSGAPPPTLNQSLVARHQQTWRLHEYHLLLPENSDELTEGDAALEDSRYTPLAPGDPLRAYLSKKMVIVHDSNGISVFEPSVYEPDRMTEKYYHRCPAPEQVTPEYARRVREILIKGEVGTLHPITPFPVFGFLKLVTFFIPSWLVRRISCRDTTILFIRRGILRGANLNSSGVFAQVMGM
jgi:hypothetical protein